MTKTFAGLFDKDLTFAGLFDKDITLSGLMEAAGSLVAARCKKLDFRANCALRLYLGF